MKISRIFIKSILILTAFGSPFHAGVGGGITPTVEQANQSYGEGKYQDAYDIYKEMEKNGAQNADLFYNLGNASFRVRKIGESVLYYEKALWLNPGHDDARFNLNYIEHFLIDKIPAPEYSLPARIWQWLLARVGANSAGWILLILLALACACAVLFFRLRFDPKRRPAGVVLAVLLCFMLLWTGIFGGMIWREETIHEGVIVAPSADVRSGPSTDNPALFTIHEGHKVDLKAASRDWYQIVLPNGWNGWVPERTVGLIQN